MSTPNIASAVVEFSTYSSSTLDGNTDEDLRCPVCLRIYKDPHFVCPNHHTLCRQCYECIRHRATSEGRESRCPQCRELLTDPVENKYSQKLIQAAYLMPQAGTTCKWQDGTRQCSIPAFINCRHCEKHLCSRHFSIHLVKFEEDCQKLLQKAQEDVQEADRVSGSLHLWKILITDLVEFLDMERERLRDLLNSITAKAESAASISNRRAKAAALQTALDSDNLRAARTSFDRLSQESVILLANLGLDGVGPSPTEEQKTNVNAAKNAIDALVGEITGICGGVEDLIDVYDETDIYCVYE